MGDWARKLVHHRESADAKACHCVTKMLLSFFATRKELMIVDREGLVGLVWACVCGVLGF